MSLRDDRSYAHFHRKEGGNRWAEFQCYQKAEYQEFRKRFRNNAEGDRKKKLYVVHAFFRHGMQRMAFVHRKLAAGMYRETVHARMCMH